MKSLLLVSSAFASLAPGLPALADAAPASVTEVAPAANVVGIKRSLGSSAQEIAVGVPWLGTDGQAVTIERLLALGVQDGDMLKVYDKVQKDYYVWLRDDGEWVPTENAKTHVSAPWPEEYSVSRGTALWLTRAHPEEAFTEIGEYTADAVSSKISNKHDNGDLGTFSRPVYNLLISPTSKSFDLASLHLADGCADNDVVLVIPTGVTYTFRKSKDSWGHYGTNAMGLPAFVEDSKIEIPANTAFWYLSAGGSPTVNW